jgi:pectate lyase
MYGTTRWSLLLSASLLLLLWASVASVAAQVKAFPSAEGFGKDAVGGRGGTVIKVTNLNDAGSGSLRACMESTSGPRTCVFTVGGTINLNSNITVQGAERSFLTVAGQTAPGDGIQIKNYGIWLTRGVHDVIIRHLRLRHGHDTNPSLYQNGFNLLVYSGTSSPSDEPYNIIIDHVSMQWAPYVAHEYSGARAVTTQWSFIAIGENGFDYIDPQGNPALSMGAALGGYNDENATISFHHNLLVSNEVRNPLIGQAQVIDFVNNISFNWYGCDYGFRVHDAGNPGWPVSINMVNSKIMQGPISGCPNTIIGSMGSDPYPSVYMTGIGTSVCGLAGSGCGNVTLAQAGFIDQNSGSPLTESIRAGSPFGAPPITLTALPSLESTLVANVGATKPVRDSLDTLYLNQFTNRQGGGGGGCSRCGQAYPTLSSGTAPTDSDNDGIPNAWETANGLNPNNGADGAQTAANGYTHLENYLNELAGDTAPTPPEPGELVAKYSFEEGTGTTAADSSGKGHTCTLNTAGWGTGLVGTFALNLDGNRYCQATGTSLLKPAQQFGIAFWMNMTTTDVNGCDAVSMGDSYAVVLSPPLAGGGGISVYYYDGSTWNELSTSGINTMTGTPVHVSATKDTVGLKIWHNAVEVASMPATSAISYTLGPHLQIGRHGNGQTNRDCFGRLDQISIYNRALTQDDVTNLYNESQIPSGVTMPHMGWTPAGAAELTSLGLANNDRSQVITTPFGFRAKICNSGTQITEYFRLQGRTFVGGVWGAWTGLTNSFGPLGLRVATDGAVNMGDPTNAVLLPTPSGFTQVPGRFVADTINTSLQTTLPANQCTEWEARIESGSPLVAGNLAQFRFVRENQAVFAGYGPNAPPDTYTTLTFQGIAPPSTAHVGGVMRGGTMR